MYTKTTRKPIDQCVEKGIKFYRLALILLLVGAIFMPAALAANIDDLWASAHKIVIDLYNNTAGISTILAGLMSSVAVIGAKMSSNQHKVDPAWDWLWRIWVAWAIINGIGAPGTGKSRGFVKPFILQCVKRRESLVVTDPKSELFESMGGYLADAGHEVRVFALLDMSFSGCSPRRALTCWTARCGSCRSPIRRALRPGYFCR